MSWVTLYGVAALTFMMVMYWLERIVVGVVSRCCCPSHVRPAPVPIIREVADIPGLCDGVATKPVEASAPTA